MGTKVERASHLANGVRRRVLEYIIKNNGGYMSQACSSAEIFACLFGGIMNLEAVGEPIVPGPFPGVPSAENKNYVPGYRFNGGHKRYADRFILSPTHYSLVLYAALIEAGRLEESSMSQFNKDGSSLEQIGAEHGLGKRKAHLLKLQYSEAELDAMRSVKRRLDPKWLLGRGTLLAAEK